MTQKPHTDIATHGFVANLAPPALRPYLRLARLDRPVGTWLLLWPGWWALGLASQGRPDLILLLLFGLGALTMRSAGCCWNDIADRHFDGRVERTRTRPIPAGDITVKQALLFMLVLCLLGLAILLQFNAFAIAVGCLSLVPVVIYPFMKRITWWPQFFLGIAFNWGALLAWAAVDGRLGLPALILYAAGICWTLGYDTVYAHQDKEDDALIGLKSSALALGGRTKPALWLFYGLALSGFTLSGLLAGMGPVYLLGMAVCCAQMIWQILSLDLSRPENCLRIFKSNIGFGAIIFAAILGDGLLPMPLIDIQ